MKKSFLSLSLASIFCCYGASIFAAPAAKTFSLSEFKLKPNVSVKGVSGNSTAIGGQTLFPLYGDQSRVLFGLVDGNVTINNNSWYLSAGLGYRQVVDNLIYGGYVIADSNTSVANSHFFSLNPGFELTGKEWDVNINAYVPVSSNKKKFTQYGWADEFDNYGYIRYAGHNQYNHHAERTDFEAIGQGGSLRIGRTVPGLKGVKVYLGGFYFDTKDAGQVRGGLAKVTFKLNKYAALEVTDTYSDRNHNRIVGGLKLTFGCYDEQEKESFGMSGRLMDQISRDVTVPIVKQTGKIKIANNEELQYDNVWFFSPATINAGLNQQSANGTFEHPFSGFTPNNYQFVWNNRDVGRSTKYPMLYLEKGAYTLNGFHGFDGNNYHFLLPENWSMFGRDAGFRRPAVGENRPVILGGLDLWYEDNSLNNRNILQSLIVHKFPVVETANPSYSPGIIRMNNAKNVVLNQMTVGADSISGGGDPIGIWLHNSALNLYSTDVHATNKDFSTGGLVNVIGIYAEDSAVNFAGGGNSVQAEKYYNVSDTGVDFATSGVLAVNSHVVFSDGASNVSAANFGSLGNGLQIYARALETHDSLVEIKGGTNSFAGKNALTLGDSATVGAYGIYAADQTVVNLSGGDNLFSGENSAAAQNNFTAVVRDVFSSNASIVNITGGKNNLSAKNTIQAANDAKISAVGFFALYSSVFNLKGGCNIINTENNLQLSDRAQVFNGMVFAYDNSVVNFLGSRNKAKLINNVVARDNLTLRLDALSAQDAVINLVVGSNVIDAQNQVTVRDGLTMDDNSVFVDAVFATGHSAVNFNGGGNFFSLTNSIVAHDNVVSRNMGIDARDSSSVNIRGGVNNFVIDSNFTGNKGDFAGVFGATAFSGANITIAGGYNSFDLINYAEIKEAGRVSGVGLAAYGPGAVLDLRGGINAMNMGIFGTAVSGEIVGVYADKYAVLKVDGNVVTDLQDVLKKIAHLSYDENGSYTRKQKVLWDGFGGIEWL